MKTTASKIENNNIVSIEVTKVNLTIDYGKKLYIVESDTTFSGFNFTTGTYDKETTHLCFSLPRLIAVCCKHIQYFDRLVTAKMDKRQNLDIDLINAILTGATIEFENKFYAAGETYEVDGKEYIVKQDRYIFEIRSIEVTEKVEMLLRKKFGKIKSLEDLLSDL